MMLNLWVKRCWFLAEHGDSIDNDKDAEFIQTALQGVSSVQECLEAMKECMDTLPAKDSVSNVSLYLTAIVNSGLPDRAQRAHDILRQAQDDVVLSDVAYNTVMHAYASSVEQDTKNATRAQEFLQEMWNRGVTGNVTTYSSLLLAFAKAGDPDRAVELLMQMEEGGKHPLPNTICYNIGELISMFSW
jgi:pentatricopeptide repeat protein